MQDDGPKTDTQPYTQVVVHLQWQEGGIARAETYGPWDIAADGMAHMAEVTAFLDGWRRETGIHPDVVTLALVMNPAEWLRARREQAEAGREYIRKGAMSAGEMRQGEDGR